MSTLAGLEEGNVRSAMSFQYFLDKARLISPFQSEESAPGSIQGSPLLQAAPVRLLTLSINAGGRNERGMSENASFNSISLLESEESRTTNNHLMS